jgi:type II secretory pathway component PulF
MTRGENPYSNSIVDLQGTANKTQPSKNLQLAIFNSVLRAILWLGLVVVGFIFVLPNFSVMFEEFGIELPHVTRFFFMLSDLAIRWMVLVLPAALLLFLGVEFAFLKSEKSRLRTILGVLWWLALLLSIGLVVVSVMSPLIAISSGLAQTR